MLLLRLERASQMKREFRLALLKRHITWRRRSFGHEVRCRSWQRASSRR
jgi:hypothetical protein